jgi:hypothetical protein
MVGSIDTIRGQVTTARLVGRSFLLVGQKRHFSRRFGPACSPFRPASARLPHLTAADVDEIDSEVRAVLIEVSKNAAMQAKA